MRGTLDILYPNQPGEFRMVNRLPSSGELEVILGGLPDIIPHWDQWINWSGLLVPATVVGNADYRDPIQPFNFMATAVWHYTAASKHIKVATRITGPVIVFTGDAAFMDNLFSE